MPRQVVRDFGTCLNFNGTTAFVLLKTAFILGGQTNATLIVWINTTRIPPNGSVLPTIYSERASSGNDIFKLEINTTGRIRLTYRDDAGTLNQPTNNSGIIVNDGKWHMVAVTKIGTALVLYVDGVSDNSSVLTATDTFTNANTQVRLGHDLPDASSWYFDYMDEVILYTRGLTPTEIANIFYTGTTVNFSLNQVGWYKLNEASGTSVTDSSGTQTAGSITAATYSSNVRMIPRIAAP